MPESATFEAIQTQELDDDSLLKDTLSVTVKGDEKLLDAEYMAVKSYTGNAQTFDMYRIVTDTTPDKSMSFTGMSLAPYELNGHIIQDLRPTNQTISYTLNRVLDGTDWHVGYIDDGLPNVTTNFYYVSAKEALKELQSLVGCEFVFKVEISGQKITDKWIEVYKEMGNRTKKRFNYGTNALTVVRETNKADIYTALIGRGKGEEVSSGEDNESGQAGYGRKITFEDIEWSIAKGNPLDKPKGQYYLELPQATQAYGIKNIDGTMKARVGIVDFDDEEDKNRLINLTYQQLLVSSRPKVLFKTTVANVGATGIGDTVTIHRHDLNIHYQTRVRKIVRNKLNDNKTQIELGDAVVTASTKRANQNNAIIKNLNQEIEKVKVDVTTSQTSADGKNTIFYGSEEPTTMRTGDTWYRPHPSIAGETQMLVWNGTAWELVIDTSDLTSVSRAVEEAAEKADEAVEKADEAVNEINTAIQNAGFTSLDDTIKNISGIASGVKSELDTAIENAGFTSLDDTIQNMNNITASAEQNAQQAISNASNAYDLAQTSISEAQTAQANSLTALGKAGNALDGVSNLNIRVDDVEDELELKADNTFINEDGTLTTLSNAITFNANRFSSDMSRIESRVESLAGEINLVVLRGSIENRLLYGTEVFPNAPTYSASTNVMGELIDVVGGESFALSKELTGADDRWRIVFYDENHNFISRFHPPVNTQDIMVAPSNARYMWVSYPKDSKPQIIRGTDFIPYRPNIADQLTSDEMVIFRNEYDEFADKTQRRLTAIDSSGGRLDTAELLITQTADGLALKADQTTVDELTGDVESLDSEVNVVAGQINSKVWKTDIDGIEIGGRNYFPVSKLTPKPAIGVDYPNDRVYHFNLNPETEYIISTESNLTAFRLKNSGEYYKVNFSETNDKGHKLTTDTTGVISIGFWGNEVDTFINGRNLFKIEKGNKATDWTPAPEDTDAKIDHIETEWTQKFDTFSQTVSSIDGRVTGQKQTIDSISSAVSGHDSRISTVEQIASGLQTTVADKANQTQVTQLANGYNILASQSLKSLVPKDLSGDTSEWNIGGNVEYSGQHATNLSTIYVTGSDSSTLYGGNRIQVESVFTPGKRYKITLDVWSVSNRRISIGQADSSNNVQLIVGSTTQTYEVIYEAPNSNGFSIYFHHEGTHRIGNITVVETTAISQSQISVLQNSITSSVSSLDGRVTSQKQTIDSISSTVSGHSGRLSTVEQLATGLQTTVADKASKTQVTQLADGYNILVSESLKSLVPKNLHDGASDWVLGGNVEYIGQHTNNLSTIYVTGSNPDTSYGGNRIQVESVLTPGRRYKITLDVWSVSNRNISIGQADSSNNVRLTVGNTTKTYEVVYEAINANSFCIYFHHEGTYRIGNITVMESTAISQSQISVLQDNINLRVTKGELLSQINVQAGGVLIQSGTNKLNVTPETTYIEDGTIKSAMIESLQADKIKTGRLDASKVKVVNIDAENITANKTSFVQSAWNAINSSLSVTGSELRYTHSDGSYTRMNANGIQTVVGGSAYQHNYLTHVSNVTINSGSAGNVQWVQLPSVFKGKDFTYFMGATDIYGAVTEPDYFNNKMMLKRFVLIKHPDYNVDYANARIPILGYAHYANIDSRKDYFRALQGIVFAQY